MTRSGHISKRTFRNKTKRKTFILNECQPLTAARVHSKIVDTYSSSANRYPMHARPPCKNVSMFEYNVGMARGSGGRSHRSGLHRPISLGVSQMKQHNTYIKLSASSPKTSLHLFIAWIGILITSPFLILSAPERVVKV